MILELKFNFFSLEEVKIEIDKLKVLFKNINMVSGSLGFLYFSLELYLLFVIFLE